MQPFAVIFDFNGTMLFDTPLQYQAWNMIAEQTIGKSIGIDMFFAHSKRKIQCRNRRYFLGKISDKGREAIIFHA